MWSRLIVSWTSIDLLTSKLNPSRSVPETQALDLPWRVIHCCCARRADLVVVDGT